MSVHLKICLYASDIKAAELDIRTGPVSVASGDRVGATLKE